MINALGNRMLLEINRQSALSKQINDTQVQITTGKRIQRASDDPVAAARVATIRRGEANNAAWARNIDMGIALSSQADTAVSGMANGLNQARELVLAGASGTLSANDRETLAQQLDNIGAELDNLAGQQASNGEPLFATGAALSVRYDANTVFAPVPSRADVFQSGGVDISQIARDAAAALRSGDATQIGNSLTALQTAVSDTADALGDIGQRGARIDALKEASRSQNIELVAERTSLESTDLSEAIALLNAQQLTLEAAQAAFARIHRQTLFDLLT